MELTYKIIHSLTNRCLLSQEPMPSHCTPKVQQFSVSLDCRQCMNCTIYHELLTSHQSWEPHKVQFPTIEHPSAMALSTTHHLCSCNHCLAGSMCDWEHLSTCFVQQVQVDWPDDRHEQIKQDVPSSRTFQSLE